MKIKDEVVPGGKWKFDENVTDAFEDMLERSIPQYDVMRTSVFNVGSRFVQRGTVILDLGCSRGDTLFRFWEKFGSQNHYYGIDVSEPMVKNATKRFQGAITCGLAEIRNMDLRVDYPNVNASLTTAVLTLQFTPIEYRMRIMQNIYDHTCRGGALVMVEKVLSGNSVIDDMMTNLYYDLKRNNSYTDDDIERKRLSLEGVLVPVTSRWNEDLMRSSGFSDIECFWRWMNFSAWIAVKR